MAKEIDKDLAANLRNAKTKHMHFAFVVKGSNDGALVVEKGKVDPDAITEAKEKCGGTQVVKGTCFGADGQLVFETDGNAPNGMDGALEKVIFRDAGVKHACICRAAGSAPKPAAAAKQTPQDKAQTSYTEALNRVTPQLKTATPLDQSGKLKNMVSIATELANQKKFDKATEAIEEAGKFATAVQRYPESMKLLTPRFKTAMPLDQDGQLKAKINAARQFAEAGSYLEAYDTLDDAGQTASALISAAPKKKPLTDPSADPQLVGRALPEKYKDEQFQLDERGRVKHGGKFRGDQNVRTNYYTDEERDKSAIRTNESGRLVDDQGVPLNTGSQTQGYVVSQETGTAHQFDPRKMGNKKGYVIGEHHSSPIQGGKAAAAGEFHAEDGVLREVTDESGHYRPTPEMTHQFVQGMEEQGVATREKKIMMLNDNGDPVPISREMEELLEEVNEYEATWDPATPYDPEMFKKSKKLDDAGVSYSNRQAKVNLTNPKTYFTPEEFEPIKGNAVEIIRLVIKKTGNRNPEQGFYTGNWTTIESVNEWIGILCRIKAVDASKTRVKMTTEQFAQTGGNLDAIGKKQAVNAEIEGRRAPESPEDVQKETERMEEMVAELGGDRKLRQLGINPANLSVEEKFRLLAKAGRKAPGQVSQQPDEEEDVATEAHDDGGQPTQDPLREPENQEAEHSYSAPVAPRGLESYSAMGTFDQSNSDDDVPDRFEIEEDSDTEDEEVRQTEPQAAGPGGDGTDPHGTEPKDNRLNIKRKKPVAEPSAAKAQYDNLGGDQALLEKLLPAWKQRNSADLATLLELNKRMKKLDGTDDPQVAKQRKSLVEKMGKTDPMPTAALVGKMSVEDRLEKLQAN